MSTFQNTGYSFAEARRWIQRENKNHGKEMRDFQIPSETKHRSRSPIQAWRSRDFFAQLFNESGQLRLSINRTDIDGQGRWKDGITWDEIQRVKNECGFHDRFAVELFPPEDQIVDVANMRHLWILDEAPKFAWRKGE